MIRRSTSNIYNIKGLFAYKGMMNIDRPTVFIYTSLTGPFLQYVLLLLILVIHFASNIHILTSI